MTHFKMFLSPGTWIQSAPAHPCAFLEAAVFCGSSYLRLLFTDNGWVHSCHSTHTQIGDLAWVSFVSSVEYGEEETAGVEDG